MGARATSLRTQGRPPITSTIHSLTRSLLDAGVFIAAARDDKRIAVLLKEIAGKSILFVASHTVAEFYREGGASAKNGLLARQWRVEYVPVYCR